MFAEKIARKAEKITLTAWKFLQLLVGAVKWGENDIKINACKAKEMKREDRAIGGSERERERKELSCQVVWKFNPGRVQLPGKNCIWLKARSTYEYIQQAQKESKKQAI